MNIFKHPRVTIFLLSRSGNQATWQHWDYRADLVLRHHDHAGVGHLDLLDASGLLANGDGGVAHDDELKRAPAQQLDDVQDDGQARERAAVHRVHEAGAGQAAVATELGNPAQQTRAQDGADHDGQQRVTRAHGGQQIGADLHDQEAHAQAEPQGCVVGECEDAGAGSDRREGLVGAGRCRRRRTRW